MSNAKARNRDYEQVLKDGTLLGQEGKELKKGLWENTVYLGRDGFVYHISSLQIRGSLQTRVAGKRSVGEYLRWVDGLFRPGELPDGSNAIHYRAARKLRELI